MNHMLLIYDAPATTAPTDAEQAAMMGAYFAFTQAGEFARALELAASEAERRHLERRLAAVAP